MPSSGKTTVAEALAYDLRLPLVAKDEIKESLYDTLGAGDVSWSGRLGGAAYGILFALARAMLASGVSLIVEANFFRDHAHDFESLPEHRLVQIHCSAPLDVLLERYARRVRHPGHHDAEKIAEVPGRYESGTHSPLDLDGELIELDTAEAVDLGAVAARVRTQLRDH
jgi:predicted kinase